ALTIELAQSPFLNVFPEDAIQETLEYMGRSRNEEVTPSIAQEICKRRGIRTLLRGSIASMSQKYVIHLDTRDCFTGEALAQEEEAVDRPEQALGGLENATTRLREQLGESLSTIQKFDVPLELATTSSLEALQAYSLARQKLSRGGDAWEALPHLVH